MLTVSRIHTIFALAFSPYQLLKSMLCQKKYNKPSEDHVCPCTLFGKYNMQMIQFKWLDMYPWIVYNTVVECVFCIFCALFSDNAMGCFVNEPCFSLNKFHEKCIKHMAAV